MAFSAGEQKLQSLMAAKTATDPTDWYPVFKARHGLQVAFECIRAELGDGEVATQLLTCCTAVDPILVAGLEPRYSEVSFDTASIDPAKLDASGSLRAVVLQHTYGIVEDGSSAALAARAHEAGAVLVEDCAHCVGRMAHGADGAPVADVSVHSFGIEKMLHTLFGGIVWVNPESPYAGVAKRVRERMEALPVSTGRLDMLERLFVNECRVFNHLPRPAARGLRNALSAAGLFEPAVSREEQLGGLSHEPMRPSEHVCNLVAEAWGRLENDERLRAEATAGYVRELEGVDGVEIPAAAKLGQPLLKFPVIMRDTATADASIEASCAAGHYTSAWYRPELGPGVLDEAAYRVPADRSGLTVCDHMVACLATLPTNTGDVQAKEVSAAIRQLVSA